MEDLSRNQWRSRLQLEQEQAEQLRKMIAFASSRIPYYRELWRKLEIDPTAIREPADLETLPILDKSIIKNEWQQFCSPKHSNAVVRSRTGGSTGVPMEYLMSVDDYRLGIALKYRGWSHAGWEPGQPTAVIGGTSLLPSGSSGWKQYVSEKALNTRYFYTLALNRERSLEILADLNRFRPLFLRGFPSAIHQLTLAVEQEQFELRFEPRAVFTVGEQLQEHQLRRIESTFGCRVFNNYGLNDGGLGAYECPEHRGLHIDMERSLLQVVDQSGTPVIGQQGRIIATSLINYGFPFLRYDTGDLGTVSPDPCPCGRGLPLLQEVAGRSSDMLVLNGVAIGSPAAAAFLITTRFDVQNYQIEQTGHDRLIIRIVPGGTFKAGDDDRVRQELEMLYNELAGPVTLDVEVVTAIPLPQAGGKHRFVINSYSEMD